jgi:hypothetical protein
LHPSGAAGLSWQKTWSIRRPRAPRFQQWDEAAAKGSCCSCNKDFHSKILLHGECTELRIA